MCTKIVLLACFLAAGTLCGDPIITTSAVCESDNLATSAHSENDGVSNCALSGAAQADVVASVSTTTISQLSGSVTSQAVSGFNTAAVIDADTRFIYKADVPYQMGSVVMSIIYRINSTVPSSGNQSFSFGFANYFSCDGKSGTVSCFPSGNAPLTSLPLSGSITETISMAIGGTTILSLDEFLNLGSQNGGPEIAGGVQESFAVYDANGVQIQVHDVVPEPQNLPLAAFGMLCLRLMLRKKRGISGRGGVGTVEEAVQHETAREVGPRQGC